MYAQTNQHYRAEDCVATIWNDLPQEFTDKSAKISAKILEI